MRTLFKKLRYGFDVDDPMSYVGKPRPHGVAKWSILRDYTDINIKIAKACAKVTGRTFYVIDMVDDLKLSYRVIIVDNVWRGKYNRRVKKSGRISGVKMKNDALFIATGKRV